MISVIGTAQNNIIEVSTEVNYKKFYILVNGPAIMEFKKAER